MINLHKKSTRVLHGRDHRVAYDADSITGRRAEIGYAALAEVHPSWITYGLRYRIAHNPVPGVYNTSF